MPPQSLYCPGSFGNLPSPGWNRVGVHCHIHRKGAVGEIGTRQFVIFFGPPFTDRNQRLDKIHIRQIFLEVVTRKRHPKWLLGIVIHMVIAMPCRAYFVVAPVSQASLGVINIQHLRGFECRQIAFAKLIGEKSRRDGMIVENKFRTTQATKGWYDCRCVTLRKICTIKPAPFYLNILIETRSF